MATTALPPLSSIIGEQLSEVAFVQDYVQFHFDGPILTAYNRTVVDDGDASTQFPAVGSRDMLCALIGRIVETVTAIEDESIQIRFATGGQITIPLDSDSYEGPEGALFSHPDYGGLLVR